MNLRRAISISAVAGIGGSAAAEPTFTGVGVFPVPNGATYYPIANQTGNVVAGLARVAESPNPILHAFRWVRGQGLQDLGPVIGWPTSTQSTPADLSDDGAVIVGFGSSGAQSEAFRWTAPIGMQPLGFLPGGSSSVAGGISPDGSVIVGWSESSSGSRAFRWTSATGMVALPGLSASAGSISRDGSTIVGSQGSNAIWWAGSSGPNVLPGLPGHSAHKATCINADGRAIAGYSNDSFVAVLWRDSIPEPLGELPGGYPSSRAQAINGDGSVVVGDALPPNWPLSSHGRAFLWTRATGMVDLRAYFQSVGVPVGSWTLISATSISADGKVIAGEGLLTPSSLPQSWVAVLDWVPGCAANCDLSTAVPVLTANDFLCFLNHFVTGSTQANCDGSTQEPTLTANDFVCVINRFAAGC